ncbi:MAG: putative bifunctional diguanylate cyclase/phosphodiesterase [Actinomycetota bacterium]
MRERIPRFSLLGKFALLSLVPIVLLAATLGWLLNNLTQQQVLSNAKDSAVLVTRLGIQPLLHPEDVREGFSWRRLWTFDNAMSRSGLDDQVQQIKIWNKDGRIVYSDDSTLIGDSHRPTPALERALRGDIHVKLIPANDQRLGPDDGEDADGGEFLEVYVPLAFETDARPVGVFEIYLPYEPIAAVINEHTRILHGVLLAGLGLLYLVLFRIVVGASRKLRVQASELRKQADESEHQALHDALTGLPNRLLLRDRIHQAILSARREKKSVGVLLMDLDRFKEINDTLGHHHGDAVLQQIGPRLRAVLRESDTLARLGGDEFAIVLPHVPDPAAAIHVVDKLRRALAEPFAIQDLTLEVDACVGIALFPEHGEDVDTLIQRADVAMYLAKGARSGCEIYTPSKDHHSASRLALLGELRSAIESGELVLHYQPKVDVQSREVTSVEALVRWQHPMRGLISPDDFVPLAEHTGLIGELTSDVICQALVQCRRWMDQGIEVGVAVNLSMRNLLDNKFPDEVAELLEVWDVPASMLTLEVTESTIMADPMRVLHIVSRLSDMGVEMSIDDFGTGYSSLAHLKRLPVAEIKIDRSFVRSMDTSASDAAIVRSTIDLAHNLGRRVVAEGVESEETLRRLAALGCDTAQGFYFGEPRAAAEMTPLLPASSASHETAAVPVR